MTTRTEFKSWNIKSWISLNLKQLSWNDFTSYFSSFRKLTIASINRNTFEGLIFFLVDFHLLPSLFALSL